MTADRSIAKQPQPEEIVRAQQVSAQALGTTQRPPRTTEYLLEEFKQRRSEIVTLIDRHDADQRYGLVVTGVLWSWLATNSEKLPLPLSYLAASLPTVLVSFFLWRRRAVSAAISSCASYIRLLEKEFELPPGLGWESWRSSERGALGKATRWFWYLLVVINIVFGILFTEFRVAASIATGPRAVEAYETSSGAIRVGQPQKVADSIAGAPATAQVEP